MPLVKHSELNEITLADGARARVVSTGNVTVTFVKLDAGSLVPEHAHPHEQVVNVIEGEMDLVVEGKSHVLKSGLSFVLPPMVLHSGKALTDVTVVDIFHPVREDFVAMAAGKLGPNPYDKD